MHVLLEVAAKTFGGEILFHVLELLAVSNVQLNNEVLFLNKDREQVPWP